MAAADARHVRPIAVLQLDDHGSMLLSYGNARLRERAVADVAEVARVLAVAGVVSLSLVLVASGLIVWMTGDTKGLRDLALVVTACLSRRVDGRERR